MPPATAAIGNDDDGDAALMTTDADIVDKLFDIVDAVARVDELLLLTTAAGLVTVIIDKASMLVVNARANEFALLVMMIDVSLVDVNVDESAVAAIVVGGVVDCDVSVDNKYAR